MKRLNLISKSDSPALELLRKSAEERGMEVRVIGPENFDPLNAPELTAEDGLYRILTTKAASRIERILSNERVRTLRMDPLSCLVSKSNSMILEKAGLPTIPTIHLMPADKEARRACVEALGGFPVIMKVMGGSHGVGVMRLDSIESLNSVADYLRANEAGAVLRKYIDYKEHARMIVLGGKVVASIQYKRTEDDFRTNAGEELDIVAKDFGEKAENVAVEATYVLGKEFGGVDLLIDRHDETPYIAEVNFPCFFPRAQEATGVDIAGLMVDHLAAK